MKNTYKVCLLISIISMFFVIGGFSFVHGEGYFLEKGEDLFVFDNLYINGYVVVENEVNLDHTGLPGDVLVEGEFNLAEESNFYFCADERLKREGYPLLAKNTDCEEKVMIWYPDVDNGLLIVNNDYQMEVNTIEVSGDLLAFQSDGKVKTNKSVYSKNGCFTNDGDVCNLGELRTDVLFFDKLDNLTPVNNKNEITIDTENVEFSTIRFEEGYDINKQSICFKKNVGVSCQGFGARGWANISGETTYSGSNMDLKGNELCCFLIISNF